MKIIFTETFGRKVKKIKRKYPNVKNDLNELLSELESGNLSGVPIPGLFNKVFKIRVASSDMKRGKSGGFRLIYYTEDVNSEVYLLTIYAKTKDETIPVKDIQAILKELDLKFKPSDI